MSDPQSVSGVPISGLQGARTDVRAAIARAAQATGVDFNYLLAQAKLESALNPSAKAQTSSAAGLYQFTGGTWLNTLEKHGGEHGMDWAGDMIEGGRVADPSARSQIMAMRYDANTSALMAAELANDNKSDLTAALGREPDAAELYMAHFLGSAGAGQFLSALGSNPNQSAAAILPKAAAANRAIFFDASGAPRSVAGVMDLMRGKVSSAMEGGDALPPMPYDTTQLASFQPAQQPQVTGGPVARQFAAARQEMADGPTPRRSMADTLASAFGTSEAGQTRVSANVSAAYGLLQKFGM